MKKNLLLYILLGFLVIMNAFFLFKHFGTTTLTDGPRESPVNFIANQLEFDENQTNQLYKLDETHRSKINSIQNDLRNLKDEMFNKLSVSPFDASEVDDIAKAIAKLQTEKELEIFYFFKAIGDLCTENQRDGFEAILGDALRPPRRPVGGRLPGGREGDEHRPPPPPR